MALPSLEAAALKAQQKEIFDRRGKPLEKAIAYPIPLVSAIEKFAMRNEFNEVEVFVWWIPRMIFASLRFDDAIHVKLRELEYKGQGIFRVSWQTKTERKRRGAEVVVLFKRIFSAQFRGPTANFLGAGSQE